MERTRCRWSAWGVGLAAALMLTGCGGGGGSGVRPEPEVPPHVPSHPATGLINVPGGNWGYDAVGRQAAHERIVQRYGPDAVPGRGVRVAIIDSGIDRNHPAFNRGLVTETRLPDAPEEDGGTPSHGTAVASVVAGLAPGARIDMHAIPLGSPERDQPYWPVGPGTLAGSGKEDAGLISRVLSERPDIINMSFGVHGLIENYQTKELRDSYGGTFAVLAQSGVKDKTLIVAAAMNDHGHACFPGTDNCDGFDWDHRRNRLDATSPSLYAGLPARIPELRGHVVAAVAVDGNREIAGFSNRCGIAARWCIAAPGEDVTAAYYGPDEENRPTAVREYRSHSGTSFAAPFVSGGLALLKHRFRDSLRNEELLARLYTTADKTGPAAADRVRSGEQCPAHLDIDGKRSRCELSSTHGQGVMNLDAAMNPVGALAVKASGAVVGTTGVSAGASADASFIRAGDALGDALARGWSDHEIALFDDLGAPFWTDMRGFVHAASRPNLESRLARFQVPTAETHEHPAARTTFVPGRAGGRFDIPFAFLPSTRLTLGFDHAGDLLSRRAPGSLRTERFGHAALAALDEGGITLGLAGERLRAAVFTTTSGPDRARNTPPATGALVGWVASGSPLDLRLGVLNERESLLRMTAAGAFGELAARVAFAGARFVTETGGWRLAADAELGLTGAAPTRGLVRELSPLVTSAIEVVGERTFPGRGRLRLSVAQPLRVESGQARFDVPVDRTREGRVVHREAGGSLVPSGRQIDVAAQWRSPAAGGEIRLGATVSFQPGHVSGSDAEIITLAGYRLVF